MPKWLTVWQVRCPKCECASFSLEAPGLCPWCSHNLRMYSREGLAATRQSYRLTVDNVTGQPEILPESA